MVYHSNGISLKWYITQTVYVIFPMLSLRCVPIPYNDAVLAF